MNPAQTSSPRTFESILREARDALRRLADARKGELKDGADAASPVLRASIERTAEANAAEKLTSAMRVTRLEYNALARVVVDMLTTNQLRQLANFIEDRWLDDEVEQR